MTPEFKIILQRLMQQWTASESVWNDQVRRDFEKQYMTPLLEQTEATNKEAARLAEVIAQARRNVK